MFEKWQKQVNSGKPLNSALKSEFYQTFFKKSSWSLRMFLSNFRFFLQNFESSKEKNKILRDTTTRIEITMFQMLKLGNFLFWEKKGAHFYENMLF